MDELDAEFFVKLYLFVGLVWSLFRADIAWKWIRSGTHVGSVPHDEVRAHPDKVKDGDEKIKEIHSMLEVMPGWLSATVLTVAFAICIAYGALRWPVAMLKVARCKFAKPKGGAA